MIPYLRAANVKDGYLDLDNVKSMDFSPHEQPVFGLQPGDVLVTEGAGSLAAVGASAVWNGELEGVVCFQNTLLRLRPTAGNDPRYLMWWARHAYGSGLFAAAANGANIYHLGTETVRRLPATIPPKAVQREIADYLDSKTARIDAVLARRREMIRALEEWEQAMLLRLVGDWRSVRTATLRQLGTRVLTGPFGTQLAASEYVDNGIPVINPIHISGGRIVPNPHVSVSEAVANRLYRHRLNVGDLVMGRKGVVGHAALVTRAEDGWLCGSDSIAIRTKQSMLETEFLALVLRIGLFRQQLEASSTGALVANVNEANLLLLRIPVLIPAQQARVVAEGHKVHQRKERLERMQSRQVGLLLELRQSLITAAVTGDLKTPRGIP